MRLTLKAARINKNLTQKQAAAKLNISKYTLAKWENFVKYPDIVQLKKLENLYDINYDDIIFFPSDDALIK